MKEFLFRYKTLIKGLADVLGWSGMTLLAFFLRYDGDFTRLQAIDTILWETFWILFAAKFVLVMVFKSYQQSWRNTSYSDLFSTTKMVVLLTIPYAFLVLAGRSKFGIPISVPIIELLFSISFLAAIRALARFFIKYKASRPVTGEKIRRILIAGAGESGVMVAKEMLKEKNTQMIPVAFVDDNLLKRKQSFIGIPVRGTIFDIPSVVRKYNIDEIIIAMPSEEGEVIQRVVERARLSGAHFRIIPAIYDLLSGRVSINQIRNVDVEDLLRRKPVKLETYNIQSYLRDKKILVTGAGGSIGSELVRQIAKFHPKKVILLGRGENSLHQLMLEIRSDFPDLPHCFKVCDIRDYASLSHVFESEKIEAVFHAAAHKHVPFMENDPGQAILNNVLGTRNLVNLAIKHQVSHFVNISTDKAVNPTSVMGASKRITEMIVEWGAEQAKNNGIFVSVRFGNVLGSRGSVIPIFKEQIKRGGPVTVTHPDMIRYFMTIPEASQLVLQAGALNQNGAVYVLDMGEPVNIAQMARELIKLSGFEPDKEIKVEYTGIRPGEKLFEELLTSEEDSMMTRHDKILMAKKTDEICNLKEHIEQLQKYAEQGNADKIREVIFTLVPTFTGFEAKKSS